jgi:hypothetical protein
MKTSSYILFQVSPEGLLRSAGSIHPAGAPEVRHHFHDGREV